MTLPKRLPALIITGAALLLAPLEGPGGAAADPPLVPLHQLASGTEVYHFINFPWGKYVNGSTGAVIHTYGMDFGFCPLADARRVVNNPQIAQDLNALDAAGVEGIRWFLIPDGRNLAFDANHTPTGRGTGFRDDLWAALDLLAARQMSVVFVLLDGNTWFKPEGVYQGALFGHAQAITDPVKRQALYQTVIIPILQDLAGWQAAHPALPFPVAAIDLGNELWFGTDFYTGTGAAVTDMQTYVREAAALVHQHLPGVPATTGAADANDLVSYWTDAALGVPPGQGQDLYSFHHYGATPLQGSSGEREQHNLDGLGKRIYLQEFPGRDAPLGGPEMYLAPTGGTRQGRAGPGWLSGSWLWGFNSADSKTPLDVPATLLRMRDWFTAAFDRPDLIIGAVGRPQTMLAGAPVSFDVTVSNQGGSPAGANRVELWIDGVQLASPSIAALEDGESLSLALPPAPWVPAAGPHDLWIKTDVWLQVDEADETNNEWPEVLTVVAPDLVVSALGGPATAVTGGPLTVTDTVANQGTTDVGSFSVAFYLSTDAVITTTDTRIGTRFVGTLAAGAASSASTPLTLSTTLAPGTYFLGAIADYTGRRLETDETNNTRTGNQLTVGIGADLAMTALTGPATAVTGGAVTVTDTVLNQGSGSVGSFSVAFYLSTDATITTADTRIGTRFVGTLAAGASSSASTPLTLSTTLAPGTYYLGAIADYTSSRPETSEANNARTGNQVAVGLGADLVVTAVGGPSSTTTGGTITVTDTVLNQGAGNANSFSVGFYLSTDAAITTADTRIGTRSIGGLGPGASSSGSAVITLSLTFVPGTYYLGAIADYTNSRPETNETNNARTGGQLTVGIGADLMLTALAGPATASTGQMITITNTIVNQGTGPVGSFYVAFYLSADAAITTADTRIGTRYLTGLAAGAASSASTPLTLSTTLVTGTYYLGAIADYTSNRPETDETNNARTGNQLTVGIGADVVVTALSGPGTAVTGGQLTATNTVTNQGSGTVGSFSVAFYLSPDATITTADTRIGTRFVGTLAASASSSASTPLTLSTTLAPGTYYLGAIADYTNSRPETSEANNARTGNQVAVGLGTDFVVTAISGPSAGTRGTAVTISSTLTNQGGGTASTSYTGLYLSTDATITEADTRISNIFFGGLSAGASSSLSRSVTLSTTLVPGTYYLGAIADYNNSRPEADETNNARAGGTIAIQ